MWQSYHRGCRCPDARESARLYHKRGREHRRAAAMIPGHGVARRLQALAWLGWSDKHIALELGCHLTLVGAWRRGTSPLVRRDTDRRVRAVYARLMLIPGPSRVARRTARAAGYASPLAWENIDDPSARPERAVSSVQPARAYHRGRPAPWAAELQRMTARGWPVSRIAAQLAAAYPEEHVSQLAWERRVYRAWHHGEQQQGAA